MIVDGRDFQKKLKECVNFAKQANRLPNYVTFGTTKLDKPVYLDMARRFYTFRNIKGRYPNEVMVAGKSESSMIWNHQDDADNCFPASFLMCLTAKLCFVEEDILEQVARATTGAGTDPSRIPTVVADVNRRCGRNFKMVSSPFDMNFIRTHIKQGNPLIFHHQTDCLPRFWNGHFGHYAAARRLVQNDLRVELYDPTLGIIQPSIAEMNKAVNCNGRQRRVYALTGW